MRLFRRPSAFLPLLLALFALFSVAAASGRPAFASAPLLTAPRAGAALRAGSLATVEWEAPPADAQEWEAFLSLDGGRSYPVRITPHLDLAIRGFTFKVPAFPTRDARILLRFGDERREVEVEAPQRFAILEAVVPGLSGFSEGGSWLASLRAAPSRGEPARPGDPGVVVWIEGARDGSGLREVLAEVATFSPSPRSIERSRHPFMPLLRPSRRHQAGLIAPPIPSEATWTPLPQGPETGSASRPPVRASIRVLTGRLNV
jgi:hypothetical protein